MADNNMVLQGVKPNRTDECRDDYEPISMTSFEIMFYASWVSLGVCIVNGYLMWKSNRLQSSAPLALYLMFSLMTLVALILYFGDSYWLYPCSVFNIFMKLPTFTYVCMAYSYMMNWYSL
jgi:hypothetical protein